MIAQWSPKNGLCHVFSTCNGGQGSHKKWRTWLKVCDGEVSNITVTPSPRGLRSCHFRCTVDAQCSVVNSFLLIDGYSAWIQGWKLHHVHTVRQFLQIPPQDIRDKVNLFPLYGIRTGQSRATHWNTSWPDCRTAGSGCSEWPEG